MAARLLGDYNATEESQPFRHRKLAFKGNIPECKVIGARVENRRNEIEGNPVEAGSAGAAGENGTMQDGYGRLERRRKHRHRSRSERKKLKRLYRQALIAGVSVTVVVLALLWWRYLVT